MKSGLDGRNNLRTATFLARQDDVSMKSGLDGRNNFAAKKANRHYEVVSQ